MRIDINRFSASPVGAFGILRVGHDAGQVFECYTVERPWLGNEPNVSCIPPGRYDLKESTFNKAKNPYRTLEVVGVPDRSLVKFHIANTMDDLQGCIGPGRELGYVKGRWAVTASRVTFNELMDLLPATEAHTLRITWAVPSLTSLLSDYSELDR